jgi:hypothetical protein
MPSTCCRVGTCAGAARGSVTAWAVTAQLDARECIELCKVKCTKRHVQAAAHFATRASS